MIKTIYNVILGYFSNHDKQKRVHDVNVKRTGLTSPTTGQDRARPSNYCRSLAKQCPHHRKHSLLNQNNSSGIQTIAPEFKR